MDDQPPKMDEDSSWLCTQAMYDCADDQLGSENNKTNIVCSPEIRDENGFGCIILNNVDDNKCYVLNEGDNTIGRHPLNHIYIEHPSVSMNHAVIQCDSDGVVLLDKGSLNKTKLNKKILKKNVAYFLEENTYLMFGEVQANYYVDEEPTNVTNEVKTNAANETSTKNVTETQDFSIPQLSCTVNTSNTLCSKETTDNVIENTTKTEIIVPKTIYESKFTNNKHDDANMESNHSSPSDAFLLDAVSQIESQLISEIVREDTLSPVMDLKNEYSNITPTSSNIFQTSNQINSKDVRDDTPSPIMDFGPLESYELSAPPTSCYNASLVNKTADNINDLNETQCMEIVNNVEKYSTQQTPPNRTITSQNNISTQISISPNSLINRPNKQAFEMDDVHEEETQNPSDIAQSSKASSLSKNCTNSLHEDLTQIPDMDDDFFNCPTQKVSVSKKKNSTVKLTYSIHKEEIQKSSNIAQSNNFDLSNSKSCNSSFHEDLPLKLDMDIDFFNCPTQKVSVLIKKTAMHEEETQNPPEYLHPRECDSSSIKNSSSGVYRNLTETPNINNEDFFNCPTQKMTVNKNLSSVSKLPSRIHEEETQTPPEFLQPNKFDSSSIKNSSSGVYRDLTETPDVINEDFFNCLTQKVTVNKKLNSVSKLSSAIHEEETQKPPEYLHPRECDSSSIKNSSSGVYKDLTETPDVNNEDFFNCPTQKVTVNKKLNSVSKLPSRIHEKETQTPPEFLQPNKFDLSSIKNSSSGVCRDLTETPDVINEDFFNCPTQKVMVNKKLNSVSKLSSAIHEEETQKPPEYLHPRECDSSSIKNSSSGVYKDLTETPDVNNEDFFNCPTQKVTVNKKLNSVSKLPSRIHEKETQTPPEFLQPNKFDLSSIKNSSSGVCRDLTETPDVINEDFFNCPTQKVMVNKKLNSVSKLSSAIHEEETQKSPEYLHPRECDSSSIKNSSSGVYKDLTETPDVNNEDFFNCPTQKVTVSKKLNSVSKLSSAIYEEETQKSSNIAQCSKSGISNSENCNSCLQEDLPLKLDKDDDFFNYPSQKVSVSNKQKSTTQLIFSIHEEETQKPTDIVQLSKSTSSNSNTCNSSLHEDLTQMPNMDDDFFNFPTQKLPISKKINLTTKVYSMINEEKTQNLSNIAKSSKADLNYSKTCNSNYMSISKKNNTTAKLSSAINEVETQSHQEFVLPNKIDSSSVINSSSGVYRDLTETLDIDNEDFFNCPTQKLSPAVKLKPSTGIKNHGSSPSNINKVKTQGLLVQEITRMSLANNNSPGSSKKRNKENIVDKIPNKMQSNSLNINENEDKDSSFDINYDISKSINKKIPVVPKDTEKCLIRKSIRLESNSNNKSYTHQSVTNNENKNSSKILKTKRKPIIRVRKDLQKSISASLCNDSSNNINISCDNVSPKKKMNSSVSSKSFIKNEQSMLSSIKQELFSNDSTECSELNSHGNKTSSKQINESTFSPLNIPNYDENSFQQHSTPTALKTDHISLNCEPSCSNTAASKWKSFWNKKKSTSANREKSGKQENVKNSKAVEIRDQYQTRAIAKKENTTENNKKRKQGSVEDKNKRLCYENKEDKLNALAPSTEIVVTFSYLKNRRLQELKQFIDSTGGSVTDEITQCTVLVTDKIRCTMKVLSAIAKGCPIVNANWIKHSYAVKKFQDVNEFLITDRDAERKYKFQLKESLARAKTSRLLEGYTVLVTPSVKPGLKDMKVIITCAGGNFIINWPIKRVQKELIVTCDQDRHRWKPMWDNSTAKIIDSDTLVMSIIRQKLNV